MPYLDTLPTDSVLRRHALTERNRQLGLPPTDAVLRRHYEQLQAALQGAGPVRAVQPAARPSAAPAAAATARPVAAAAAPRAAPAPAVAPVQAKADGGLFGWLRRLLGAS